MKINKITNRLFRLSMFMIVVAICYALDHSGWFASIGGLMTYAMCPALDLDYNADAFQPKGSEYWWMHRVHPTTGALLVTGQLSSIKVTNGGSSYETAPTVVITPHTGDTTGSGAEATAKIYNGVVFAIELTNLGGGYTLDPDITFTGGGGTGATATATIKDKWHLGFARLKSDFEFGQDETPVFGESGRQFATKKDDLKGDLTFTSGQDDVDQEHFMTQEVSNYSWAIFQHAGMSETGKHKYRYFGIVKIPKKYKVTKPDGEVELKGIIVNNISAITVDESKLPVSGLIGTYDLPANAGYIVQNEPIEPSI